jgi:mono/diheme cytochrome c family protein
MTQRTIFAGGIAIVALSIATAVITITSIPRVQAATGQPKVSDTVATENVERGRYVVNIAGCNDCHTPMFGESNGTVPEADRLTGMAVGFSGPWGTSYAKNLRRSVDRLTEDEWVNFVAKAQFLPPMPGWAFREMKESDIRAVYAYVKWLGPAGEETPSPLPPGELPSTPFIEFVPTMPRQ